MPEPPIGASGTFRGLPGRSAGGFQRGLPGDTQGAPWRLSGPSVDGPPEPPDLCTSRLPWG
eukprot:14527527-Alexandrium_andersonii.AAC.1